MIDINYLKNLSRKYKCDVRELVALTKKNDPFYILASQVKCAEWLYKLWRKEGCPRTHPRAFYYRTIEKKYKLPDGKNFGKNIVNFWTRIQEGFKYARLLGLINDDNIIDAKNPDGIETGNFDEHKGVNCDYYSVPEVYGDEYEDDNDILRKIINKITDCFTINFNSALFQPFYIELWAEKSGVIPEHIARKYNATIRPAGAGEFSLDMCYQAVKRAKELNKPLFVFVISDFDTKGIDMPKSAARKIEFYAKRDGVTAYVKHILLTQKQCEKYNLPEIPSKEPKGDSAGAKGYRTQTKTFCERTGRKATEINSFLAREPDAYDEIIHHNVSLCFDEEMDDKTYDLQREIREKIKEFVAELIGNNKEEILTNYKKLRKAEEELQEFVNQKKEELGISNLREEYETVVSVDTDSILQELDYEMPVPEFKEPEDVVLDTNLDYMDQIKLYKNFDVRYYGDGGDVK